ncbi:AIPR family protein [Microbacterium sp. 20-116]|uniref:AIPR family protein n=1 Tax=Microbacterium sp. 20-116 TaxID=3239883 RepID=UPI0034E2F34C
MLTEERLSLLLDEVEVHRVGNRTEQAALLAWFLESVWRLDPEDVISAICDGPGDKGIDAIYVDDDAAEITVFQSKWRKSPLTASQGDADLKQFVGAGGYFEGASQLDALLASKPNDELRKLLARQNVREILEGETHSVKMVFLTLGSLDSSGRDYVASRASLQPPLAVYDVEMLADVAVQTQKPALRSEEVVLTALEPAIVRELTDSERMAVTLVQASELVTLPGIADQTLFSQNVRYSVGKTLVNRQLAETVGNAGEHRLFPAFHNGLTLLTEELTVEGTSMKLRGVGVVNGCQSLTTLHANADKLTDGLALLVKVVQVPSTSTVSDRITQRSNNQNAVTLRDQRSNDKTTRALQRDVSEKVGDQLFLAVKNGEKAPTGVTVVENTTIAQLIMATYLEEPWAAVRKIRLFDQDFRRIFTRSVGAYEVLLMHLVDLAVSASRTDLRSDLASSFAAVKFTVAYLVACVLKESETGSGLLATPQKWLSNAAVRAEVLVALETISREVIASVNDFVEMQLAENDDFDPKVAFKNQSGVTQVRLSVLNFAKSLNRRGQGYFFAVSPIAE